MATALSVAGIEGAWLFHGFLPAKPAARRKALQELATRPDALVFYEAPHRIEETIDDLLATLGGERSILFARELTKKFEQLHACTLADAPAWLAADDNHRQNDVSVFAAHINVTEDIVSDAPNKVGDPIKLGGVHNGVLKPRCESSDRYPGIRNHRS